MRIQRFACLQALLLALIALPVAAAEAPVYHRYTTEAGDTLIGIGDLGFPTRSSRCIGVSCTKT